MCCPRSRTAMGTCSGICPLYTRRHSSNLRHFILRVLAAVHLVFLHRRVQPLHLDRSSDGRELHEPSRHLQLRRLRHHDVLRLRRRFLLREATPPRRADGQERPGASQIEPGHSEVLAGHPDIHPAGLHPAHVLQGARRPILSSPSCSQPSPSTPCSHVSSAPSKTRPSGEIGASAPEGPPARLTGTVGATPRRQGEPPPPPPPSQISQQFVGCVPCVTTRNQLPHDAIASSSSIVCLCVCVCRDSQETKQERRNFL